MAKETGQESKLAGQDNPLYKAWLRNGLEHLRRIFGRRLADVLVAFAIMLLVFLAGSFVYGLIWYLSPIFSANDNLSTTDRRDLVQGFASVAQAAAVGLAGAVGLVGLFFTWRSLRQARESQAQTQVNTQRTLELTEQGQITERFTRSIDQLGATDETTGKPRLELRLGGIYALERIAWDSPERDYSTVMEVLTAYVRENTTQAPRASEGSSEEASTPNESTAEADEGAKQPAPPEPRRPTADIQAILDVLRRAQTRLPEEYRTRLDLHEATLQSANLQGATLQSANLVGTNLQEASLQGAILEEANLQGANLQGAILDGANLQDASLQEAILQNAFLQDANLQRATLRYANLQEANLQEASLQEASLLYANLEEANLVGANLQEASLQGAVLEEANLEEANLREASLQGAILHKAYLQEASLQNAFLQNAFLQDAFLQRANLEGVNFQRADLQYAFLQEANLQEANLQGANLYRATVTDEQLADAQSLQGAIMPDGQTYEDWRKEKEGSGKDVENE
jgi:uncharacterized protein YjbI with pentapeptide repeats